MHFKYFFLEFRYDCFFLFFLALNEEQMENLEAMIDPVEKFMSVRIFYSS